jgi:hypothetical protein
MKKILSSVLSLVIIFSACKEKPITTPAEEMTPEVPEVMEDTVPRTSITFILGKDASEYNQYYTLANHYYRLNPEDKTEIVIDTLQSIWEVSQYIRNHLPENNRPYGLINLVSHGNEFAYLSARVYPKGPRTTVETLQQALQDSIFVSPDTTVIDSKTLIFLHGCAVGNNAGLINGLARAFGNQHNGVTVKASKYFEYYAFLLKNKNPKSIRHYYAKAWYAFYHPDSILDKPVLVQQLEQRYPEEQVSWKEGISRRFQSNPGEIYHFSFIVPVVWEEIHENESDMPSLNSKAKKSAWLMNNQAFLGLLQQTHIPLDYFQFKYYQSKFTRDDKNNYRLSVKARVGVICLIQPLIAPGNDLFTPFQPVESDTLFFEFSKE